MNFPDINIPLVIPSFSEADKEDIRTYYDFYEPYKDLISDWAEEELALHPAWGKIIQSMDKEEQRQQRISSQQAQREAVYDDNWLPYLKQLSLYGIFYARIGMDFHSWFEVVNLVRRYLTPHLLEIQDKAAIVQIMNGLNQFMDVMMSSIGEAYLFEQKRIIERQKQEQELLNKDLENFVYIASHDLQEPLNTINSFANLLEEDYGHQFTGDAKECLMFIKASSIRMSDLITGLLDYSKVSRDREFQDLPLQSLVQEVLADMHGRILQTGAKVEIKGTLPVLPVTPIPIKLLFQNLVSNAIKFKRPGVAPFVSISAEKEEGCYHFVVEDNGIGIEAKNKDKIFEIFRRLHHSSEYEGTGIGLAHCKKIVEVHGGKIWMESTPGVGSKFHFTLCENQEQNEEAKHHIAD